MIPVQKKLIFTRHAQSKMAFYGLSEQRVKSVLRSPKRVQEGVAPKTVAMMAPTSLRAKQKAAAPLKTGFQKTGFQNNHSVPNAQGESWTQEIWVMVQDVKGQRTIISAWRYPGMTKPGSGIANEMLRGEYDSFREMIE